jgi:hypothetical protein
MTPITFKIKRGANKTLRLKTQQINQTLKTLYRNARYVYKYYLKNSRLQHKVYRTLWRRLGQANTLDSS